VEELPGSNYNGQWLLVSKEVSEHGAEWSESLW